MKRLKEIDLTSAEWDAVSAEVQLQRSLAYIKSTAGKFCLESALKEFLPGVNTRTSVAQFKRSREDLLDEVTVLNKQHYLPNKYWGSVQQWAKEYAPL